MNIPLYVENLPQKDVNYEIIEIIGETNVSKTMLVNIPPSKKIYIMKTRNKDNSDELQMYYFALDAIKNIMIDNCLYKDRFICYKDIFINKKKPEEIVAIYEREEGVSLSDYWKNFPSAKDVDFSLLMLIAHRLFSSLDILHKNKIYHRDIKPQNIIINEKGTSQNFLKLIDFDFSCGKNCFMSPMSLGYHALDVLSNRVKIDENSEDENSIYNEFNWNIDWEKADVKSALFTIISLYTTNVYQYIYENKGSGNFQYYVKKDFLKHQVAHKHKLRKGEDIEKSVMNELLDIVCIPYRTDDADDEKIKNLRAQYVIDVLESKLGECYKVSGFL
jgi:hypothetical protein